MASCDDDERAALDNGHRPWSWYLRQFDPDGDGILCNHD
jgi:hypothetical protein